MLGKNAVCIPEPVVKLFERLKNGNGVGAIFARGALRSLIAKALGLGIGFLLQIVIARVLGIEQFGVYAFALSWVNILLVFTLFGANKAIIRFLPPYRLSESTALMAGLLRWASSVVLSAGLALCLALWAFLFLSDAVQNRELVRTMALASLLLPILGLSQLRQAGLIAMKQVFRAEFADTFIRPLLLIILAVSWHWVLDAPVVAHQAMLMQLAATIVAFLIGARWLKQALPNKINVVTPSYDVKVWRLMALPMMFIAGIHILLKQTDVIMLGMITGTTESGVYSVMSRLSNLAMFGLGAATAMAAPMIAELHDSGKMTALRRVITLTIRGSLFFMLGASAFLICFGEAITTLYGPGFAAGLSALYILLIGQAVNAATGPLNSVVSMTGHQMHLAKVQGITATINIFLNLCLIPRFGMVGAATATTTAIAISNLWLLFYVHKHLNIRVSPF